MSRKQANILGATFALVAATVVFVLLVLPEVSHGARSQDMDTVGPLARDGAAHLRAARLDAGLPIQPRTTEHCPDPPHANFTIGVVTGVTVGDTITVPVYVDVVEQGPDPDVWATILDIELGAGLDCIDVQPGPDNDDTSITQNHGLTACYESDRVRFITVDVDAFAGDHVADLTVVATQAGTWDVEHQKTPINQYDCQGNYMAHRTNATTWCGGDYWEVRDGDPTSGTTTRTDGYVVVTGGGGGEGGELEKPASTWSTVKRLYR